MEEYKWIRIQEPEIVETVAITDGQIDKSVNNDFFTWCKEVVVPLKDIIVPALGIVAGCFIAHDAMEHGYSANIKFGEFADVSIADNHTTDLTSASS